MNIVCRVPKWVSPAIPVLFRTNEFLNKEESQDSNESWSYALKESDAFESRAYQAAKLIQWFSQTHIPSSWSVKANKDEMQTLSSFMTIIHEMSHAQHHLINHQDHQWFSQNSKPIKTWHEAVTPSLLTKSNQYLVTFKTSRSTSVPVFQGWNNKDSVEQLAALWDLNLNVSMKNDSKITSAIQKGGTGFLKLKDIAGSGIIQWLLAQNRSFQMEQPDVWVAALNQEDELEKANVFGNTLLHSVAINSNSTHQIKAVFLAYASWSTNCEAATANNKKGLNPFEMIKFNPSINEINAVDLLSQHTQKSKGYKALRWTEEALELSQSLERLILNREAKTNNKPVKTHKNVL